MRRILKSLGVLALIGGTVATPFLPGATAALLPAKSIATLEAPITENFDSLAAAGVSSATPAGWGFVETGSTADSNYTAEDGSISVGDTYSYGSLFSTERALGQRRSQPNASTIGAAFTNDTG